MSGELSKKLKLTDWQWKENHPEAAHLSSELLTSSETEDSSSYLEQQPLSLACVAPLRFRIHAGSNLSRLPLS